MTIAPSDFRSPSSPATELASKEPWGVVWIDTSMTMWELDRDLYLAVIAWAFATVFLTCYVVAPALTANAASISAVTSWKCS